MDAPVVARGRNFTVYDQGGAKRTVRLRPALNYLDDVGQWRETQALWESSPLPSADVQMVRASYRSYAFTDFSRDRLLSFASGPHTIELTPLPIVYTRADHANPVVALNPVGVPATVDGGLLTWSGAYGPGTTLEWGLGNDRAEKRLWIDSPARWTKAHNLTRFVGIPFRLGMSLGLRQSAVERVRGRNLSELTLEADFTDEARQFLFKFARPLAIDANNNVIEGELRIYDTPVGVVVASIFPWAEVQAAAYPLMLDPTVTQTAAANADDGSVMGNETSTHFPALGTLKTSTAHTPDYNGYLLWRSLPIEPGSVIESAVMNLTKSFHRSSANPTGQIFLLAEDSAAVPASYTDLYNRVFTTALTTWVESFNSYPTDTPLTTPNFAAPFQEVIDRPGWISGNNVVVIIRDQDRTATLDSRVQFRQREYTNAAMHPELVVTYSDPVSSPPLTPTNFAATTTDTAANLSWDAALNADAYRVFLLNDNGTETKLYDGANLGFTHGSLQIHTTYRYVLEAYNVAGSSPRTAVLEVTPGGVKAAPTIILSAVGLYKAPGPVMSALIYDAPDWSFFNASAEAVEVFSGGADRNRLLATGSTDTTHIVQRTFPVAAGTYKLMGLYQADTAHLFDFELYTDGSTYFDWGGTTNLTTGTNDFGATITALGGGVYRYEKTYTIPSGTTQMQVRLLIFNSAAASSYVPSGEALFAGATTFDPV